MRWKKEVRKTGNCGWYKWFAWTPVYVAEGYTVWLETVERRLWSISDATYEYRLYNRFRERLGEE